MVTDKLRGLGVTGEDIHYANIALDPIPSSPRPKVEPHTSWASLGPASATGDHGERARIYDRHVRNGGRTQRRQG